jgi:hypothetical protein
MRNWNPAKVALISLAVVVQPAHGQRREPPLIAQVDHVMFVTADHQRVIRLLTDTLGLPLVWPAPGTAPSTSSGISLGNVVLEMVHSSRATPFLSSLALQAVDWATVTERMRERGVPLLEPGVGPVDSSRLSAGPRWSIQSTTGFGHGLFVIQYHHFDMNERRANAAVQLKGRAGGPLGVVRMREIVAAVDTVAARLPRWQQLFGEPDARASWAVGAGPRITLANRNEPVANSLVVEVESLERARRALDSLRIQYRSNQRSLDLDSVRFGGLKLRLQQH